jgi:hypothetical protein
MKGRLLSGYLFYEIAELASSSFVHIVKAWRPPDARKFVSASGNAIILATRIKNINREYQNMPNIRDSMRVESDYLLRPVEPRDREQVRQLLTRLFLFRAHDPYDGRVDRLAEEAMNGTAACTIASSREGIVALAHSGTGHYVKPQHQTIVPSLLGFQNERYQTFNKAAQGQPDSVFGTRLSSRYEGAGLAFGHR